MTKTWVDSRLLSNGRSVVVAMIQRSLDHLHEKRLPSFVIIATKLVTMLVSAIAEEHQGLQDHDHDHQDHLHMIVVTEEKDVAIEIISKEADLDLQEEIEIMIVKDDQITEIEVQEMIGIDIITAEDAIVMTDINLEVDHLFQDTIKLQICVVMIVIVAIEIIIKTTGEIDLTELT